MLRTRKYRQTCKRIQRPNLESAHRALMRAHLLEGNPSEAVRQYTAIVWLAPNWA